MDIAAYDVVDNAVNDARYSDASNLPPHQKFVPQIPSIFCRGYHRDDPQKRRKFRENLTTSFWEFFWNWNYFFLGPPLQGVRMLRFYFWVLEGAQLHKKFRAPGPPVLEIWGVKVSTFPPLPQKLGGQKPSIFCIGYTRDDLQKPCKFYESLTNSFRDIRLFAVRAYRRDTIVSSTLKAESLYSDEYSFTAINRWNALNFCSC